MADLITFSSEPWLDGFVMTQRRNELGVTQAAFACACGWSQQYQSKLECSGKSEISTDKARTIECALSTIPEPF